MSKETSHWLRNNILSGFTDKGRQPWWADKPEMTVDDTGESLLYSGAVPVGDVQRRLFNWEPESTPVYVESGEGFTSVPDRQAVRRSDNHHVMGIFKGGYTAHPYNEWLVHNVATMLDDELSIASAGLLKGGAVAWTQIERPETVHTPEGVDFRPFILAATSFDGSLATTYQQAVTLTVCDNTLSQALGEDSAKYRVKHTKGSAVRVADARTALGIMFQAEDDFAREVAQLCAVPVSNRQYDAFLDDYMPLPDDRKSSRGLTLTENRREAFTALYRNDPRVTPWAKTAFGIVQCANTYNTHVASVHGGAPARPVRNLQLVVNGKASEFDSAARASLKRVLQAA